MSKDDADIKKVNLKTLFTKLCQNRSYQFDNFDWFANSVSVDQLMHYSSIIMNQNYQISGIQDVEEGPISGSEIVYKRSGTEENA